ncbi:unnamed protein product [Spirodela intermedia]|uniref:Uncharacterized protein n=1 Tax=Spirodela intermedia TaxID=51605 RepID=A0A7I8K236_SPIIN|nr:unnamed protein product [Spirodela intermedia]
MGVAAAVSNPSGIPSGRPPRLNCLPSTASGNRHAPRGIGIGRRISAPVSAIWRRTVTLCRSPHAGLGGGRRRLRSDPSIAAGVRRRRPIAKESGDESGGELDGRTPEIPGTVFGAVSLIIGTSIGSGMLALPQKTSHTGFVPSAVFMAACWAFLMLEALLLAEVNVSLMREQRKNEGERGEVGGSLEVISFRTMAEETLGGWVAHAATVAYVFLAYTSTTAYAAKAGELLSRLVGLPTSVSGTLFTLLHAALIVIGGASTTDRVNQWLTTSMLGLLVGLELAAFGRSWSGLADVANWGQVPSTIPVIIFSLVYHDIAPVICSYLGGDLPRIRSSFLIGSVVPLLSLLIWDAIVLGFSADSGVTDPFDLFMSDAMALMVEVFSLLAVATSLIGTLLGFSQFFQEQLRNSLSPPLAQEQRSTTDHISSREDAAGGCSPRSRRGLEDWWAGNNLNLRAMSMAVIPALLVSTTVPDVFYLATDIAGGYCMTVLYGILPPAMAWGMHARRASGRSGGGGRDGAHRGPKGLSESKPALIGVGLCAFGIVIEQMLQDLSALHL